MDEQHPAPEGARIDRGEDLVATPATPSSAELAPISERRRVG
jgi:hypothetical protein